jgi:hypothetical protein
VRAVLETFEDAARLLVDQLAKFSLDRTDMGVENLQSLTMTPAIVEKVEQIQTIPLHAIAPEKTQTTTVLEFQITIALVQVQINLDSQAHYLEGLCLVVVWQIYY